MGGGWYHFDMESSTLNVNVGALMWPSSTLKLLFNVLFWLRFCLGHIYIVLSRQFVNSRLKPCSSSVCEGDYLNCTTMCIQADLLVTFLDYLCRYKIRLSHLIQVAIIKEL